MFDHTDLPLLHTFAAVVRHGSFTGAATALRVSKSVVSERVRALEERSGVAVLQRSTRKLRLTPAGEQLMELAIGVGHVVERVGLLAARGAQGPEGRLRVACTVDLGVSLVAPAVARLVRDHPGVQVEIIADDAARDPLDQGVDVAVRLGKPRASRLTVRTLARFSEPILAAPSVAGRLGAVTSPRALAGAPWVRHSLIPSRTLRFTSATGATEEVSPRSQAEANTGLGVLALLVGGAGVGCLPEYMAREHLAAERLVVLCRGWWWREVSLYVLLPPRSAIRAVHRAAVDALREQLTLDGLRWRAS